jgi:polar amino acid transport system permease protein
MTVTEFILKYYPALLEGCWQTLRISSTALLIGTVISICVAHMRGSKSRVLSIPARSFIELIRNTPIIVQIFFIYFSLPVLGLQMSAVHAAILSLSLNCSAYLAEIIRGGIQSVNPGQTEAGYALGLNKWQVFFLVTLKPAIQSVYPSITSQYTLLLLSSSVISTISARELTSVGNYIESETFLSFEVYFTVTILYFAMASTLNFIFQAVEPVLFPYTKASRA